MVWSTNAVEHRDRDVVAPMDFLDYRKAGAFADMQATYSFIVGAPLTTAAGTEQIVATAVTPGMFEMLGRSPALGRTFTPTEVQTAVIVSNRFWRSQLGSDVDALGRVLTISGQPRTIVGVMPPDFVFPYKSMLGPTGFSRSQDVEAWLPLEFVNTNSRATGRRVADAQRALPFGGRPAEAGSDRSRRRMRSSPALRASSRRPIPSRTASSVRRRSRCTNRPSAACVPRWSCCSAGSGSSC